MQVDTAAKEVQATGQRDAVTESNPVIRASSSMPTRRCAISPAVWVVPLPFALSLAILIAALRTLGIVNRWVTHLAGGRLAPTNPFRS